MSQEYRQIIQFNAIYSGQRTHMCQEYEQIIQFNAICSGERNNYEPGIYANDRVKCNLLWQEKQL